MRLRGDLASGNLVGSLASRVDLGAAAAVDTLGVGNSALFLNFGLVIGVNTREETEIRKSEVDEQRGFVFLKRNNRSDRSNVRSIAKLI